MDLRLDGRPALTRELVAAGYSHNEVARLRRAKALVRLRRGAYRVGGPEPSATTVHRQLVQATAPLVAPDAVVSHLSAAVLHGLPVWESGLSQVQVTRAIRSGRSRGPLHVHAAPLPEPEVVQLGGVRVTSSARTVVDLGRSLPFEQAVAAGDAAVRAGLALTELQLVLATSSRRPGVTAARRVVAFLDGRSESPGESLSRVVFARHGLPAPQLQYEVFDEEGFLIGRTDFCWEGHRTLGEFDGKVKYGRLVRVGETAEDVVYAEKRREDALRDQGWQMVRWGWADLKAEASLVERVRRAFGRAHPAGSATSRR